MLKLMLLGLVLYFIAYPKDYPITFHNTVIKWLTRVLFNRRGRGRGISF
jgi:hypothetical protein